MKIPPGIAMAKYLVSDLSRCGWESLKVFFQIAVPEKEAVPGAVIAIQSFGDFLGFNPNLHVLGVDGCFYGKGMFRVVPRFHKKDLEKIFRHKVFKMLLSKGKTTEDLVNPASAGENIARYIIRAFLFRPCPINRRGFSQERMTYVPAESKVVYRSKDGRQEKVLDALEWLAAMCSHVPNKGEQMVRYYGYYSKVSRGKRKKQDLDDIIPSIMEPEGSSKAFRKNWARLIQKIYEIDPLC
ncbi:MAG: transposase, partial [Desulfobacteraceae bacterium]|nr:transposase [Desulfobacteraceae bacterium]